MIRCSTLSWVATVALIACFSCDSEDSEDGSAGGSGSAGESGGVENSGSDTVEAPSEQLVGECRDACDNLQSFDCITADGHEACWGACDGRSASELDVFSSCVSNELPDCDHRCLQNLFDADPIDPSGDGPSACVSSCEAFIQNGCGEELDVPNCALFCESLTPEAGQLLALCLDSAENCQLDEACIAEDESEG